MSAEKRKFSRKLNRLKELGIYGDGSWFRLSDVTNSLNIKRDAAQEIIDHLINNRGLLESEEQGHTRYRKPLDITAEWLRKRWVDYVPPRPVSESHLNPWVR